MRQLLTKEPLPRGIEHEVGVLREEKRVMVGGISPKPPLSQAKHAYCLGWLDSLQGKPFMTGIFSLLFMM